MSDESAIRVTTPMRSSARSRWSAMTVLALVLAFGVYGRLHDLGRADFWNDELFHVLSAGSIDEAGVPRLPTGEAYRRGIDITRLVRVAGEYVADPEAAARLPSAGFGIAGLFIFAAIAWRLAGPWAAVWATLLLAIFPVALQESRNTRFYTQQLAHGLIALYAGWRAVQPVAAREGPQDDAPAVVGRWGWIALALVAFAAAARVQPSTLSVFAGWCVAVAVFAAIDLKRFGRRAMRESATVQATVLGVGVVTAALLARPGLAHTILDFALEVPLWAEGQYSPRAYYWMLSVAVPVILSLMPLIFLIAARRNWALSAYLLIWFAVPFTLHSFLFRFQADRYVVLALPALFLATAIAAADGCTALFRALSDAIQRNVPKITPRVAELVAAGVVLMIAGAAVLTTPAFTSTRKVIAGVTELRPDANWRSSLEVLRETPGVDTLPWGALQHLPAYYYWKRLDFSIERGLLEPPRSTRQAGGPAGSLVRPEGTPDHYLGIPVLWSADAVRQHFGTGRDIIIAIDSTAEEGAPGGVIEALRHGGPSYELCKGRCGVLHLHRWTLTGKGADTLSGLGANGNSR